VKELKGLAKPTRMSRNLSQSIIREDLDSVRRRHGIDQTIEEEKSFDVLNVTEKEDLDGSHPRRLTSALKRRDKTPSRSGSGSMRGQLRSELLYQNFRDKQQKLLEKRL